MGAGVDARGVELGDQCYARHALGVAMSSILAVAALHRMQTTAIELARLYAEPDPPAVEVRALEAEAVDACLAYGRAALPEAPSRRRPDEFIGGARVVPEAER
jgi:hypothetical protein